MTTAPTCVGTEVRVADSHVARHVFWTEGVEVTGRLCAVEAEALEVQVLIQVKKKGILAPLQVPTVHTGVLTRCWMGLQ